MSRNVKFLVIALMLIFFAASIRSAVAAEVSVVTSKDVYVEGDRLSVEGNVSPVQPNQAVTVAVTGPPGFPGAFSIVTPEASGRYRAVDVTTFIAAYPRGTYTITSSYAGVKSSKTITYGKTPTVTLLQSAPEKVEYGQKITFTASTSPARSTGLMMVEYSSDRSTWTAIRSGQPADGKLVAEWTPPSPSTFYVRASWSGDDNYAASTSSILEIKVSKTSSTISLTSSKPTGSYGEEVTIRGSLQPRLGGVTIKIESSIDGVSWQSLAELKTQSDGSFTYVWKSAAGSFSLRSKWDGSENVQGSQSSVLPITISKALTTTTVTSQAQELPIGSSFTITASLTPQTVTGKVVFETTRTGSDWAEFASKDAATKTESLLNPQFTGATTVRVRFAGDPNHEPSTSNILSLNVVDQIVDKVITVEREQYKLTVTTNSTVTNIQFSIAEKQVSFTATGPRGSVGKATVQFPAKLLGGEFTLKINDKQISPRITSSPDQTVVSFTYQHEASIMLSGTTVIPEFPAGVLGVFFAATLIAVAAKFFRSRQPQMFNRH